MIAILLDCPGEPMRFNLPHLGDFTRPGIYPVPFAPWDRVKRRPLTLLRVPFEFPTLPMSAWREDAPIGPVSRIRERMYRRVGTYLPANGEVVGLYMPVCG